ncbi:hypothetical protein L207DRAFT_590001 [Hyaloscypha variabilis F]|uniref:Uncharacterized protein n=1 Tax=Hyaloscypha variabilis (strain UAMH 11265 / GT02V1 / F) TaxID=1149755 RepID=A0A2J6R356_HYAVF|nr:hypothetical protein L207DRAFT_590001 [Hyaloscypha variabilis F]
MASQPKQDNSPEIVSDSARNSYASATDSHPRSARSSFASIDTVPSSVRTSYSSLPETFTRISSFSRTATGFVPDSETNTPLSSRDPSPDSPKIWKAIEESNRVEHELIPETAGQPAPQKYKPVPKDGFEALKGLQDVRNVVCVAFGAFDRYYISWEDNKGDFHQECQALPECLNRWLFPGDGQTRDLRTLQVSLGSNDEFFVSDKDGKLSSRDPSCQIGEKKAVPRLAEIARGMMRKKANTVSTPTFPENLLTKPDSKPESPKLVRRSTFQSGQDNLRADKTSVIMPLIEQPLLTRLESKQKSESKVPIEDEIVVKNLDDGTEKKLDIVSLAGEQQLTRLESKPKLVSVVEQPISNRPIAPQIGHSRRKSILIGAPPPVRPMLPKLQTVSTIKETLQSRDTQDSRKAVRTSLPKIQSLTTSKELPQPQRSQERLPAAKASRYVDACVQTEIQIELCCAPLQAQLFPMELQETYSYLPPQHEISIGHMQDFCRDEYQLGGMLSTYV